MDQLSLARDLSPFFVDPRTLMDDPHASFALLREEHPVIQIGKGQYIALRADDVLALLTDPRTKQIEGIDYAAFNGIPNGFISRLIRDFLLFSNDESHRRKRALFSRTFAHGPMLEARGRIRSVADRIVADLPRGEDFDFLNRMASRVPAEMIAAILGLPESDAAYFSKRAYQMTRAVSPVYPLAEHDRIERATAELFAYVLEHMQERVGRPRQDILSELVTAWQEDRAIPFTNLVHQVLGVVVAATDTTRAAFAMLVALLLKHPEQWQAAKGDPSLIPGAIAEGLRFEPSAGSIPRFTLSEIRIGGTAIPAGAKLMVSTMSAMRDPSLYIHPEEFDIRRPDHPRLQPVFGLGPHRCLGEMLARLEMQESLSALIAGAPNIEMLTEPRMIGFGGIRQITPMRVKIH